jgi:uncharacterized protein YndB with AHSA1/START domain
MSVQKFDFRVEGRYEYAFAVPGQDSSRLTGQFLDIKRPHRLSFSWQWLPPDPHSGIESHVTVEFFKIPEGTHLSLTHTKLDSDDMKTRHDAGWDASLYRLETYLLIFSRK